MLSYVPCLQALLTSTIVFTASVLDHGWGHKVNRKQNLFASFSHKIFSHMKFYRVMKQFKLQTLILLLSEMYVMREVAAVFLCQKT